jgi:hypothetical protein
MTVLNPDPNRALLSADKLMELKVHRSLVVQLIAAMHPGLADPAIYPWSRQVDWANALARALDKAIRELNRPAGARFTGLASAVWNLNPDSDSASLRRRLIVLSNTCHSIGRGESIQYQQNELVRALGPVLHAIDAILGRAGTPDADATTTDGAV